MISKIKSTLFAKISIIIILSLIVFFGLFLRHHNYIYYPRHGATFDEFAWTWLGVNLIKEQIPISWSPHPIYKDVKEIKYQGARFLLVKPYLEHPPLFGLVAGGFAILRGADNMYDVNLHQIRLLSLILGSLSILLVFLLANDIYGKKIGLLSAFIYAVVPTIVIGSRLVQNENFFIPVWLLSLFLVSKYLKNKNPWFRNLAALLCGILILSKIPWAAASLSMVMILLYERKFKDILKILIIIIPIALIFVVYGFYWDKELFLNLWLLQLNRYDLNFDSIYALFLKPYLIDRLFIDGWIYFGWFSLLILFTKNVKENLILVSAIIAYFLVFLTAIPDEASHGWYRYPFYPFLVISTAVFLKNYFTKNWILTFFFLVFMGTSLMSATFARIYGFSYTLFRISIITWGFTLLPYFFKNDKIEKLGKISSYTWLILIIFLSSLAVYIYIE